ncbi:Sec-independent protein translocase subunit TatA [Williamsia sp. CHRR-6]|uniref:Sec-independent protein translocase subunit TatA n=1 Tax=Williamsia sp. CHRR-6 TaxID=2835871 RepID=UPI001BDAE394|nr:Sec-independent protein translocase subunit TatA [Williamsia sp. CHRR-6]MBT0568119.1 Sec-independent protein translocase subunit TatA [Williamsia sp. CHRR-6]
MGAIQPWHIIVVVIVFLILFGSKKLPDAARGLGRSMRIFKSEVQEMQNDGKRSDASTSDDATRQIPAPSPTDAARTTDGVPDSERRSA